MIKRAIILLILTSTIFAGTREQSLHIIEDSYPVERYKVGLFNLIFGAATGAKGIQIINDDLAKDGEKAAAWALVGLGAARVIDASLHTFRLSPSERFLKEAPSISNSDFKPRLAKEARVSRFRRNIRASLIAATAGASWYLYGTKRDDHKLMIVPGTAMTLISSYLFFFDTPAEKAFKAYKEEQLQTYIYPYKDGLQAGLTYLF